jgi:hypothetical protein
MTEFDDQALEAGADAAAEDIAMATGGIGAWELEETAPHTLLDPMTAGKLLSGPAVTRTVLEPLSDAERDAMRAEFEEAMPNLPSIGRGLVQGPNGQMIHGGGKTGRR